VDAVVLAGGINRIQLFEGYTPGYKALLPFGEKPAIQYTLDALRAVPQVQRTCIVGPEAELRPVIAADDYAFVPSGETLMESIFNGLAHFKDSPMTLVATADVPLVTPQAITDFFDACAQIQTTYAENVLISVVPQRCYTGDYERFTKGFNRFKDVAVCHGNLMLADPRLLDNTEATRRMNNLYNARKNPLKAALAIGWRVGLSYVIGVELLHALTMEQMSRIASWRFGVGIIPVIVERPEITIDVDEAADYAFVRKQLEKQ
jgi:molybdopterin-guanine dinucleotide biosynthesis protein A